VPLGRRLFREHLAFDDVGGQFAVALFVELFHLGNLLKRAGYFRKSFLPGDFRGIGVEHGPLHIFSGRRSLQIAFGVADHARRIGGGDFKLSAFQILEKHFGVLFFIFRRLQEKAGNLFVSLFLRGACKKCIAVSGLRFAGKRCQQVFLRLGPLN